MKKSSYWWNYFDDSSGQLRSNKSSSGSTINRLLNNLVLAQVISHSIVDSLGFESETRQKARVNIIISKI